VQVTETTRIKELLYIQLVMWYCMSKKCSKGTAHYNVLFCFLSVHIYCCNRCSHIYCLVNYCPSDIRNFRSLQ